MRADFFCGQTHLRDIFGAEFDANVSFELEDGTKWTADMEDLAFQAPTPVRPHPICHLSSFGMNVPIWLNVPILNMAMQIPVNYQTEFECLSASLDALEAGFGALNGLLSAIATRAGLTPAEIANAKGLVDPTPPVQPNQFGSEQEK